jgi:hypothetical protein
MASFLEAAGPLALLAAQGVYLTQPFLRGTRLDNHVEALSAMLESKEKTLAFIQSLREARTS